jgi:hypothetical protein
MLGVCNDAHRRKEEQAYILRLRLVKKRLTSPASGTILSYLWLEKYIFVKSWLAAGTRAILGEARRYALTIQTQRSSKKHDADLRHVLENVQEHRIDFRIHFVSPPESGPCHVLSQPSSASSDAYATYYYERRVLI